MPFQSTVFLAQGFGVVGELYLDGPMRAQPGIIDSAGIDPAFNRVGRVFTMAAGVDGHMTVGGSGVFAGILANPKVYPNNGTQADGTLAPSLDLARYSVAEFIYMATGLIVRLEAAAVVGNTVDYDTTTGALYPRAGHGISGAGTVAVATNVATVAALPAGKPSIGIGTVIQTASGPATVLSLGTGMGGNGTYNVSNVADSSATAFTYDTAAPSGRINVPHSEVIRYDTSGAGLAVISLTN